MRGIATWLGVGLLLLMCVDVFAEYQVGVAQVDITPDYPVRLSGFGFRRSESEGVTQKIWAKALAISDGSNSPAVIVCVDNVGIPAYMTSEVAQRLKANANLDPARLAITCTHTHTAPMLTNVVPTIFGRPIPPDQQERIDRYTHELTDKIEQVALEAIKSLRPGKIEFGTGAVGFAINRRTPGGPVDHDFPILAISDPDGSLRAVYFSYACHCVTLSNNKISGDWAGYAMQLIAEKHPGTIALASVGCGADQNPSSNPVGDKVEIAEGQGRQVAEEVEKLLKQELTPLTDSITTRVNPIELLFDKHPTREQLTETAKKDDYAGYHARVQLAKLDRGEKLATSITYPIQTWNFGDQLAMVFLPGEVVVDYSLRLKRDYDRTRLWLNAYSNDAPCYIPSERILKEGGYEGGGAMIFYDRPTRLAPGLEDKIVAEVHRQLPQTFLAPKGTEGVAPRTPEQSRRSIRTKADLQVELVASEPLVASPVAIDWGADGRLWVCEMFDYPTGADQNWAPGGRIKVLTDTDHDGRYDQAKIFLENIPFPTGITAWGKGVLVCAAPDILYAEDTDGDGKADKIEKLFSGFATGNYQARVNSLSLGLDNYIYGANGLLGGTITDATGASLDVRNHDFRFRPLHGALETVTGLTQQGRVRDDWGRWFGCDNSRALLFYPHEERYLRRNPHAPAPPATIAPPGDFDIGRVYPISRLLQRFNDPDAAGHVTSACGIGIYRDTFLGDGYAGNAFTAEPVHNLVHRMILSGDGAPDMKRHRADDERESEFFASTDNWTRPVQVRTGPDGALYVVDMYRFLIEHPRWIPPQRLAELDVRAGAGMGRIYRLRPKDKALREVRDLTRLTTAELAAALDSPNGTDRDRAHIELLVRHDPSAKPALEKLASDAKLPQVRVQALSALEAVDGLTAQRLVSAMRDSDAHVRAHAVKLCEPLLRANPASVADALLALTNDQSPLVRHQLAFTLGEWNDPRAGDALARLATASLDDPEMRVAVLSSCSHHCGSVLSAVMSTATQSAGRDAWIPPLVATAAGAKEDALLSQALLAVLPAIDAPLTTTGLGAMAALLDELDREGTTLADYIERRTELHDVHPRVASLNDRASRLAADAAADQPMRESAIRLLGRGNMAADELKLLCKVATSSETEGIRNAAITGLRRQRTPDLAKVVLADWQQTSPAARPEIVNLLLSRSEWAELLLGAVKKRQVQPSEIPLADRQRLLESTDPRLRQLAIDVFPAASASKRAEVLQRYQSIDSLSGIASRGADLFTKNCATCHALNGLGHDVGPDLSALRNKPVDYFAKNILDPSAVVEPRFVNYVVDMKDGRTLSGVIKAETTSSVTLATGGGAAIETLPRADIKTIRATSSSMMPEGFETALPPQQMADLIAFIKSGASSKKVAGNVPKLVAPQKDGSLMLRASAAEIVGDSITFEAEFGNIGYWSGRDDQASWTIRVDKPGPYDVHVDYACAADAAGNSFVMEIGVQKITGIVAATGPDWSQYRQIKIGSVKLEPGQQRVILRPSGDVHGALMDLRTIALAAPGAKLSWPAASPAPGDGLLRDPASIVRLILDSSKPTAVREAPINANPQFAADLIAEMTNGLTPGTPLEYERIPWIWRVAIVCGKGNDADQIRSVLAVSVPQLDQPLHHWQSVVIGGGIINGISQRNVWPAERIAKVIGGDQAMTARWKRSLELASSMADDEKVPTGTRYDALRMLGVEPWEKRGEQLKHYLKMNNAELQMGAVSALADVQSAEATTALIDSLADLTAGNRNLAVNALLRDSSRCLALLEAIEAKKVDVVMLGDDRREQLKQHADEKVRRRAAAVLAK